MSCFRDALAPDAVMAIVDTEIVRAPHRDAVIAVIRQHSEIEHHQEASERIEQLRASGRFALHGQERTGPMPFGQSVEEYIDALHSTSALARVRLGDRAAKFDEQIRQIFARHQIEQLRYDVAGIVAWGRPL